MSVVKPSLFVVATPIGNLRDLSGRAIEILDSVDLILAEDTRESRKLLDAHGIRTPMKALHEHNEGNIAQGIVRQLCAEGLAAALISDAGTPLIHDPGYVLVQEAIAAGLPLFAVPGPCAAIAALSISGIPCEHFIFDGFLPSKSEARRRRIEVLAKETRTLVFYESPHRIQDALADLSAGLGPERKACVARELTKMFESAYRGALGELAAAVGSEGGIPERGEFVLVVAGGIADEEGPFREAIRILHLLSQDLSPSRAVALAAELTGVPRNRLYRHGLEAGTDNDAGGGADPS
jgi:16S rRNA (cytidine1402-2'-O)-methyltransferase